MLPVIADRKLLRKLSSAAIQTVLFSDFIYHVWELMVFPKPGTAPIADPYQNLSDEALRNNQLAL